MSTAPIFVIGTHRSGTTLLGRALAHHPEVVYWEDLRRSPENGFSLFGLAESLRAQGRRDAAVLIEERFRAAWAEADVQLTTSRY